jgi:hydrogenase expression/formation protein HypE
MAIESDRVLIAHGGGGSAMQELVREVFIPALNNQFLETLQDSAVIDELMDDRLAFTTDAYVVRPLFFPGGDIGRLAVSGTVNDLAMAGARPLYISLAVIIEEGFPVEQLQTIAESIRTAADEAGVKIVTGDTKVVEKGAADGIFITTAGIGIIETELEISSDRAADGDAVIVNGYLGDHGIAVMSKREGIEFQSEVESDVAPLAGLVQEILAAGIEIHVLRDPTRGGAAAALNEIADSSEVGIRLNAARIPVRPEVRSACDLLGLDPLYVPNEGKLIALCPPDQARKLLTIMRKHPLGSNAAIIGEVTSEWLGHVIMETEIGGTRIVETPYGEQLPRIC